MKIEVQEL